MNPVDVALMVLVGFFVLRGFWRGFFRESFGFLALVAGIFCALEFTGAVIGRLPEVGDLLGTTGPMVVFVGIFVLVHTVINLVGLLLDRIANSLLFRTVSRLTGGAFGAFKGAAVSAFVLLFLHLFPVSSNLDRQIRESQFARPLVDVATTVLRYRWRPVGGDDGPAQV